MSLSATIKSIQDILRKDAGVDGDAQRISQLCWMLFLKIFDFQEDEAEMMDDDYKSPLPKKYRWRNWAKDPEGMTGDDLLEHVEELFKALKELKIGPKSNPRAAVVRAVFEDAYNYQKSGQLLRQVINKLNEIDFSRSADFHQFGGIYEQILSDLRGAGNAGEYYTPRGVTQFIVDMVDPKLGERILDPACGTGGFLTSAIEHVRSNYVKTAKHRATLQSQIHGVEKKPMPHMLCVTNMLLHGIEVPDQIRHDNTLNRPLRDYKAADRVDVIITNPPFGGMEEDGIETNFPASYRTRETADLFLVLIIHLLKKGGRGAVVLPDGTLFGDGVKARVKQNLLEECNLHTIVRLPKGVFSPYTSIKTNLLFFTKGEATKEIWFYEHPYPEGYKSYSKTKPLRVEEFEPEKSWWNDRQENEFAWRVPVQQVVENGYNLDLKNPHEGESESHDPDVLIAQYKKLAKQVEEARNKLRDELGAALGGGSE
ncbi:MAG: type I restriction-modification system subunit M [bacterium]|nr:type I restriction-modification system subunit M [bacterium]